MIQNAGGIIPIYKHKRANYKGAKLNSEHITQGYILNYEGVTQKSRGKKQNNVGEAQSFAHIT